MERLGILGGTFDPPHVGHLVLAEWAQGELHLDRVLWVPAGDPWRKTGERVTAAEHRTTMVRLAIEHNQAFELWTAEVERAGPSYTVDTLAALAEGHGERGLFFVMGSDALEDLPHWREPERIIRLARLAVARREETGMSVKRLDRLVPGLSARVYWLEMPRIDVSATELRRRAAAGLGLRYLVPDAVEEYIREHRLYDGG